MFISIDDSGKVYDQSSKLITDPDVLEEVFLDLQVNQGFQITSHFHGQPVLVEAFDEPLIATRVLLKDPETRIQIAEGLEWTFELKSLTLDAWDRFHGVTSQGIPFVMSGKAQDSFFDQLDEFDDDSIIYNGKKIEVPPYWVNQSNVQNESYWTDRYDQSETAWDLGAPAPGLKSILSKLKLPKSRILVLGGGKGHDAAYFAEFGHQVTMVDISDKALAEAQALYKKYPSISYIKADLFDLPRELYSSFDLIFEHTCFCAINPGLRPEIIKVWNRLLAPQGHLLGVFFTMPKKWGPPFGGSEWEIKKLLLPHFRTLYWQRLRNSVPPRMGKELLVYCEKA